MKTQPKVTFHVVKNTAAKLKTISDIVGKAFIAGEKMLIAAPSAEAAAYIDQLLWRMPEESFLPHVIAAKPVPNRIAIAVNPTQNFNQATILLNLAPAASPIAALFAEVHELFDETDPTKAEQSLQRQRQYGSDST
jgi:DNA polymerase III subunit chi